MSEKEIGRGWQKCYQLLYQEITPAEFARWLYDNEPALAAMIGEEQSAYLRSFDLYDDQAQAQLPLLVRGLCEMHNRVGFARERARRLLHRMLDGSEDPQEGCRTLASWYHAGYDFIPVEYVAYSSDLQTLPPEYEGMWNKEALAKRRQEATGYKELILKTSRQFLTELDAEEK